MRITAGDLKGKEVLSKKNEKTIRPTSGRVREAIFNLLKHGKFLQWDEMEEDNILKGKNVVDIYSGTGILGFEAISRGAGSVTLIDKNDISLSLAKKTAEKFGLENQVNYLKANATNLPVANLKADIVFMDPPYDKNLVKPTMKSLVNAGWLNENAIIVAEHSKKENLKSWRPFDMVDQRKYNNTSVTIFRCPHPDK